MFPQENNIFRHQKQPKTQLNLTQSEGIAHWRGHLVAEIGDGIVSHMGALNLFYNGLAKMQILQHRWNIDAAEE